MGQVNQVHYHGKWRHPIPLHQHRLWQDDHYPHLHLCLMNNQARVWNEYSIIEMNVSAISLNQKTANHFDTILIQ